MASILLGIAGWTQLILTTLIAVFGWFLLASFLRAVAEEPGYGPIDEPVLYFVTTVLTLAAWLFASVPALLLIAVSEFSSKLNRMTNALTSMSSK